jgi:membrane-bound serine protease (ClpP class)
MRRLFFIGLLLALLAPLAAFAEETQTVCVIAIREEITHNTLFLVRRGLREAEANHADALILDMDTNGGRVDITEEIIKLLERATIKTYTFVDAKAFSAGAYIAAATDQIYMTPGSVIGAATPLVENPDGGVATLPTEIQEKMTSAMRALIRATAQEKHHNPEVFEAMVDSAIGLTIDGKEILPKGKLLTLTADEASHTYGTPPTPLLSAGTIGTLHELLAKLGYGEAKVVTVTPYGFEVLARWITEISPLLIIIGMVAIYLEIKTPGITVPAIIAVVCFGLYFLGYFVAGFAGWEEGVMFIIGFALLAVEVMFPGHLLSGITGFCLIILALMMAMTQKWPGGSFLPTWPDLQIPIVKVLGSFIGSIVVMIVLGRFLPKSALFKKMELSTTVNTAAGYSSARIETAATLGATGLADTLLRPSGRGKFGEAILDVVTEGEYIERGTPIKIIQVQGSRIVVEKAG